MSQMSQLAQDFDALQTVLDSEADFQQNVLPALFDRDGILNRVDVRRAVKSYVGRLLRQDWNTYSYLDEAISGTDEQERYVMNELASHWEVKFGEGCYS